MGSNEMFSSYNEIEKKELLEYLKNYKLEFSDSLGLSKNIRFGIEIETEGDNIYSLLTDKEYRQDKLRTKVLVHSDEYLSTIRRTEYDYENCPWILKKDYTVKNGAEIHSPILTDTPQSWDELELICYFLQLLGGEATDNTAVHIHFSKESFLEDIYDLYNLIKLYCAYENVLYNFGTGEFVNFRERIHSYSSPLAKDARNIFHGLYFKHLDFQRFLTMVDFTFNTGLRLNNLQSDYKNKNTFEFRFANGTLSPEIIQNLINADAKMCRYAVSRNFDDDFVTRKFNYMKFPKTKRALLDSYLNVPLEDILEFVDLIFDNTTDKLNFLRQSIKEPQHENSQGLQKAKKFY